MRLQSLFAGGLSLSALLFSALASPVENAIEPLIEASASFPEENAFGHVVNGERNTINLVIENKSDQNVTLQRISGAFHHPETGALIKNTTSLAYVLKLISGTKLSVPYQFYSEFKPGDIKLSIWLEHTLDDEKYVVAAYDSIVTIVEPEGSWFDFKLILTYAIVTALFGGLSYFAYLTFVPQSKVRKNRVPPVSAPVTVTATGTAGYQEEWIPEHHLKKPKASKKKVTGIVSSGDELSGSEVSTNEARKRKGRK